ncbi:efflux RND transporter permease subunit [Candidatus Venteria ishoeyi]|uniref:Cobalt-zinc-cadmium resistance protein CzcA n=3 Tax=Candidatus Venteria ishoeyi TaxID=1899563 RepID=A0A1H6F8S9_9GAMM|nr:CusA/CzcA family heavy metal efflux RND transporter [Candidatus Venteria ishoeyi]SEH06522.1 Cobalt-zinc-cadmium resistance protein CzcA [Candidatus Venteria ishoeyi]
MITLILRYRLLVLSLGLLFMAAGWYAYQQLPLDAFPDVSPNLVQVFTVTDGLAPEEIEKYVTYPLETAMNGLPGVSKIRSVSNFGLSVVNVYFDDGVNLYFARQLVNERLQEARERIPESFGTPELGPIATGMGLVLFYYLADHSGQRELIELRSLHDRLIKYPLQTVPGVTEVLGIGGHVKQYQVIVNPQALLRYQLRLPALLEKIAANNLNVGAQFIERNDEELVIRAIGLVEGVKDLRRIVVATENGTPVYLHQVADIRIGGEIRRGLQSRNGSEEVVAGMVVKLFGSNASTVIASVENKIAKLNQSLPEGLEIIPYYEQKSLVEASVNTVTQALLQGLLLILLVLVLFLGSLRGALVVALALPFSLLFALLGMYYFDLSINLMSFGGLAIAIGMLVDSSIVMVENINRHLRKNIVLSRKEAVLHAAREVLKPIIFALLIIILVFLPLLTLQGVEGKTFRPLAYSVALALAGALVFTLFLLPGLSSLLMKRPKKIGESWLIRGLLHAYRPIAALFIHWRSLALMLAMSLLIVGALIFPRLGAEFTPTLQEGTLMIRLTMAPSISLPASKRLTQVVERRLLKIQEIREVVSRIGRGEVGAHADPVNSAEMYVLLHPREQWRVSRQTELQNLIRQELGEVTGVMLNFTQPIAATIDELLEGVRAQLAVKLFGDDLAILKTQADSIAAVLQEVPGAADVQVDQVIGAPQLLIKIKRDAVARYGFNIADVQQVVQAAVGGAVAGQVFEGTLSYDILLRYPAGERSDAGAIGRIAVSAENGLRVPLSQLTDIQEIIGPRQITRENTQRFITIQCNVTGRDIGSFVKQAQQSIARQVSLPPGYLVTWGGQYRLQQEANQRLLWVIPITLLLVFLLLYTHFNRLSDTILILLNIPLALAGGVVALWLAEENLSVPASVGFIALFGIALGNGMVLISSMRDHLGQGLAVKVAALEAACLRLRPVLMTALTTALGLLPLLYADGTGSEVQRPLALVVMGGLVSSTLVTLLIIPSLYSFLGTRLRAVTGKNK